MTASLEKVFGVTGSLSEPWDLRTVGRYSPTSFEFLVDDAAIPQ